MENSKKIIIVAVIGVIAILGWRMRDSISKLIENFEGFSATPYNDPPGSNKWSIGFGHQIQPNEHFTTISRAAAAQLLVQDMERYRQAVDDRINVPLNSEQYAALVSFVYNVGIGAFINGSVDEKINNGDFKAAAETMRRYVKAGGSVNQGLVARRAIEAAAFDVA